MNDYSSLLFSLHALAVYRSLLDDPVVSSMIALLGGESGSPDGDAELYGETIYALESSGLSLSDYIYSLVLYDDNAFTRLAACNGPIPQRLSYAVQRDLCALSALAYVTPAALKDCMKETHPLFAGEIDTLPEYAQGHKRYVTDEGDWGSEVSALREFCHENGCGEDARFRLLVSDEDTARSLLETAEPGLRRILMNASPK